MLVAVGGVMLGWRTGLVLAAVGVVTVFAMAYAETSGLLPAPALVQTAYVRAIWMSDFLAITAVAMVLFAQELTGARDRALAGASEIARSEQAVRAVMDNAPFGAHMYRLDDDDRLVFIGYNQKAEEMLGLDHAPLLGRTLEEAFPATSAPTPRMRTGAWPARAASTTSTSTPTTPRTSPASSRSTPSTSARGASRSSSATSPRERKAELALREANEMLAVAQRAADGRLLELGRPDRRAHLDP